MRRGQEREKEKKRRENTGEREKNTGGRFETTENTEAEKHRGTVLLCCLTTQKNRPSVFC
ncbi:hypothetical protein TSYNTROPHJE_16480 [Tepidanaerobacter syntrophicus]|nr:hypothetical protein TSYNTROPHJE_16480 [Tepidanaerobacter syntrophicus]